MNEEPDFYPTNLPRVFPIMDLAGITRDNLLRETDHVSLPVLHATSLCENAPALIDVLLDNHQLQQDDFLMQEAPVDTTLIAKLLPSTFLQPGYGDREAKRHVLIDWSIRPQLLCAEQLGHTLNLSACDRQTGRDVCDQARVARFPKQFGSAALFDAIDRYGSAESAHEIEAIIRPDHLELLVDSDNIYMLERLFGLATPQMRDGWLARMSLRHAKKLLVDYKALILRFSAEALIAVLRRLPDVVLTPLCLLVPGFLPRLLASQCELVACACTWEQVVQRHLALAETVLRRFTFYHCPERRGCCYSILFGCPPYASCSPASLHVFQRLHNAGYNGRCLACGARVTENQQLMVYLVLHDSSLPNLIARLQAGRASVIAHALEHVPRLVAIGGAAFPMGLQQRILTQCKEFHRFKQLFRAGFVHVPPDACEEACGRADPRFLRLLLPHTSINWQDPRVRFFMQHDAEVFVLIMYESTLDILRQHHHLFEEARLLIADFAELRLGDVKSYPEK